jgi:hypothetical protein
MEQGPEKDSTKNLLFSGNETPRRQPRICPKCGTWNPPDAEFCGKDGVKLPEQGRHARAPHFSQSWSRPAKSVISTARPGTTAHGITTPRVYDTPGGTEDRTDRMEMAKDPERDAKDCTAQGKPVYSQTPKDHLFLITVCILLIAVAGSGFCWRLFIEERAAMQQNLERRANFDKKIDTPASPPDRPQQTGQSVPQPAGPPDVSLAPETRNTVGPEKTIDREMKSESAPAVSRKAIRSRERKASEAVRDEAIKKRSFTAAPTHSQPKNTHDGIRARPKEQPPDRARIEKDINRLLLDSGAGSITAEVSENMTATLKGTVRRNEDRHKALSVAKGFKEVGSVKDVIFVIGP